jgi:hypothetical protein
VVVFEFDRAAETLERDLEGGGLERLRTFVDGVCLWDAVEPRLSSLDTLRLPSTRVVWTEGREPFGSMPFKADFPVVWLFLGCGTIQSSKSRSFEAARSVSAAYNLGNFFAFGLGLGRADLLMDLTRFLEEPELV